MTKVQAYSLFTDFDIDLFRSGYHCRLFEKFGSHLLEYEGKGGCYFAVYAPSAYKVELIGSFNHWNGEEYRLNVRWDSSGIWEGFVPGIQKGELYKFKIYSDHNGQVLEKFDPYARKYEIPPQTASVVWDDDFEWSDQFWSKDRERINDLNEPISIYELHIGSWKKKKDSIESLDYRSLADELCTYISDMQFTHVEFLPVMEHPYYPSWGYLSTGFFAPTSRFGDPEDFKYLVNKLHENNIGVILDWVPAHFPSDAFALAQFDGTCVYEHPDPKKGYHPDWNSLIFNFERPEIRSFLLSSAHFWVDQFHADGLRVDAVASMLYLDYSREHGEWEPNEFGNNHNLAAIHFLKELNKSLYAAFPYINMIAEESTAYDGVTRPVDLNGLGFGLKWMMGWMNDGLEYISKDPIYRKYHHNEISRSLTYAFTENYCLPISHDEVVHGKQALIAKMPGDRWQQFANHRLFLTYMFTHPGQKLLFMGSELGQFEEWDVNNQLSWYLLDYEEHRGVNRLVKALNQVFRSEKSLYEKNYSPEGFEWIDYGDSENSVLIYIRKAVEAFVVVVLNFSPVVRNDYEFGVPVKGDYIELFNSDAEEFGGSNVVLKKGIKAIKKENHGKPYTLKISLAPLAGIILKLK